MAYVLGLDLGARSLGWAAITLKNEKESALLGLGVRVFEAGVEGSLEAGREESRSVQRRIARLARRQTRRRRQRARQLYQALANAGLLPPVRHAPGRPEAVEIQRTLNELDGALRKKYAAHSNVQQLPYLLRARALDAPLEGFELGRALYHLGQRRGFLSNRKAKAKDGDDQKGVVYSQIHALEDHLRETRTLGEYLAGLDPSEHRIRNRYTHRKMYEAEFEQIWAAQKPFHPELTDELKDTLVKAIFHQRPLQDTSELVGRCEWDPAQKRTQVWRLEYQRFRILQTANHLRLRDADENSRPLSAEQRQKLVAALSAVNELSISKAKNRLGVANGWKFTLEEGGEKKLKGDGVSAQMVRYLGEAWDKSDNDRRTMILEAIDEAETDEALAEKLEQLCGLSSEAARFAAEKISLPRGWAPLSLETLKRVLPFLEEGLSVQEARMRAGFELTKKTQELDFLPPLQETDIELRNPAVARALTETRKVVNAVIREWGKPAEIHIEMARELKSGPEQRKKAARQNRQREELREQARKCVEGVLGEGNARRKDIELVLLHEECGGICPYTGQPLGGLASILNGSARVQVEHIIPRSISLDDSFANLTLATVEANREKGNRTPWEAYGHDENRFAETIERVKNFKGEFRTRKLDLFRMQQSGKEELLAEFSARHLNDTRYASRLAAEYLGLLYGGEIADGKRKVLKATGQVTAVLRRNWDLNRILSGDSRKSREDHRHHAIDAAVLAVVNQGWIQRLSIAAENAWKERKRDYASIQPPWVGFKEDLEAAIHNMHISHRPEHRITGSLHKETHYSYRGKNQSGGDIVRVRKPVHALGKEDFEKIVDPLVRQAVKEKVQEVGEVKKLESDPPVLPNRNGPPVPVRKVRIELNRAVRKIGTGYKARYAEGSETHHVEVCEVTLKGKREWRGDVVSMREAMERLVAGRDVVDRSETDGRGFLFSLCKGDTVKLQDPGGARTGIWVVRKIMASQQVLLIPEHVARPESERDKYAPTISGMRKLSAQKVVIDPLGQVLTAND